MQCVRNVSYLNHLRHVGSVLSCAAHVNGKGAIQSSDTLMIQEVKRVAARSSRGGNFSRWGCEKRRCRSKSPDGWEIPRRMCYASRGAGRGLPGRRQLRAEQHANLCPRRATHGGIRLRYRLIAKYLVYRLLEEYKIYLDLSRLRDNIVSEVERCQPGRRSSLLRSMPSSTTS